MQVVDQLVWTVLTLGLTKTWVDELDDKFHSMIYTGKNVSQPEAANTFPAVRHVLFNNQKLVLHCENRLSTLN